MLRSDLADDFPTIIEKVVVWYDNQHLEYRCSYLMVDIMEHTELRENFAPLSVKVIKLQDNAMFQKRIEEWPVGALDKLIQCVRKQEYAKTAIDQSAQTYEVVTSHAISPSESQATKADQISCSNSSVPATESQEEGNSGSAKGSFHHAKKCRGTRKRAENDIPRSPRGIRQPD